MTRYLNAKIADVLTRVSFLLALFYISGSAFKLIQHRAYHHGTMLIDTDLSSLGQYLKVDRTSLVTKGVASVRSPVTRLRESSFTIDHLSFCEATRTEFLKRYAYDTWRQNMEGEPITVDEEMIEGLEAVKAIRDDMKTWEWMYGQTPEFSYQLEKAFSWGTVVSFPLFLICIWVFYFSLPRLFFFYVALLKPFLLFVVSIEFNDQV